MTDHSTAPKRPARDLILRAAKPQDAESLTSLMNLPGFRWGTTRLPFQSPEETRTRLDRFQADSRHLLAFLDQELVGSASLERRSGRRSHVGEIGMGVHDAWVNRGIGTSLMAALIDLADNWLGLRRLELMVNTDNAAALALYRRFGFEVEGTHRGHVLRGGAYVDCFSMARLACVREGDHDRSDQH